MRFRYSDIEKRQLLSSAVERLSQIEHPCRDQLTHGLLRLSLASTDSWRDTAVLIAGELRNAGVTDRSLSWALLPFMMAAFETTIGFGSQGSSSPPNNARAADPNAQLKVSKSGTISERALGRLMRSR